MKNSNRITRKEGLKLLKRIDLLELGRMADEIRIRLHPENIVTFVVDRNINYTNVRSNHCDAAVNAGFKLLQRTYRARAATRSQRIGFLL